MADFTPFAALIVPSENDPPSVDNNAFFSENPYVVDRLLKVGAVTHRHDAHDPLANPTSALTGEISAGGGLPGSSTFYAAWTQVDSDGGETAASPILELSTPAGYGTPSSAIALVADYTAGIMPTGDYYYAKTFTDGAGGETPLSPASTVYVSPGYASAQVQLSGIMADATDLVASARLWRSYQGSDWHLLAEVTSDTYTDTGFDPPDNPAQPPANDSTAASSQAILTLPGAIAGVSINLYFSDDPSMPDPSLFGSYPAASANATVTVSSFNPGEGSPPLYTRSYPGAAKINPDTDMLDFPWKRPVQTFADLPSSGNEDEDTRIVVNEARLYQYVASAGAWQPLQSTGGPTQLTVEGVDNVTTIDLEGATLVDNGDGSVTIAVAAPSAYSLTFGGVAGVNTVDVSGATVTDDGDGTVTLHVSSAGAQNGLPAVTVSSQNADYTLALSDAGKVVEIAAQPPETKYFYDTFTPADNSPLQNHTSDSGGSWDIFGGNWVVLSGATPATFAVGIVTPVLQDGGTYPNDYTVRGTVPPGGSFGLWARLTNSGNTAQSGYLLTATELTVLDNGNTTQLGAFPSGTYYALCVDGDQISVYIDGAQVLSVTDSTVATGIPAIQGSYFNTDGVGNFVVCDAAHPVELGGGGSTLTIPANADVAFEVGTIIEVCDVGTVVPVTIVAASGVALDIPPGASKTSAGQWSTNLLRKRGTDEWVLVPISNGGSSGSSGSQSSGGVAASEDDGHSITGSTNGAASGGQLDLPVPLPRRPLQVVTGTGNPATATLLETPTPGNVLVAWLAYAPSANVTTQLPSGWAYIGASPNSDVYIYSHTVAEGDGKTYEFTTTGSTPGDCLIAEFVGINSSDTKLLSSQSAMSQQPYQMALPTLVNVPAGYLLLGASVVNGVEASQWPGTNWTNTLGANVAQWLEVGFAGDSGGAAGVDAAWSFAPTDGNYSAVGAVAASEAFNFFGTSIGSVLSALPPATEYPDVGGPTLQQYAYAPNTSTLSFDNPPTVGNTIVGMLVSNAFEGGAPQFDAAFASAASAMSSDGVNAAYIVYATVTDDMATANAFEISSTAATDSVSIMLEWEGLGALSVAEAAALVDSNPNDEYGAVQTGSVTTTQADTFVLSISAMDGMKKPTDHVILDQFVELSGNPTHVPVTMWESSVADTDANLDGFVLAWTFGRTPGLYWALTTMGSPADTDRNMGIQSVAAAAGFLTS